MNIAVDILEAVADEKGIDPEELDFRLTEYIDPDAIARLAAHQTASWTLSFELPDHNVTVTSDGLVLVDGVHKEVWTNE
jgi:hypothetical protein